MRVLILSTDTKHHTYFINKLFEQFDIAGIVYERRRLTKDYLTGPFFTQEEAQYEENFFDASKDGVSHKLPDTLMQRMIEVHSVNQEGVADYIRALEPDVAITYGVGLVKPHIFSVPRWGTINVHHGSIEEYRGLDSHLWAIYHQRFDRLGVTIHYVDEGLDTGNVLDQEQINISPNDEIYHLRYKAALKATQMVSSILTAFAQSDVKPPGKPQQKRGLYYSTMPLEQKHQALEHFQKYKEELFNAG